MFDKRIAFLIESKHLVPHGGIGQFCKAFVEMAKDLSWKVDIILDVAPRKTSILDHVESLGARILYSGTQNYKDHQNIFAFAESINFEKMVNFRNSLFFALCTNLYDAIVCNSPESMPAAYSLNIHEYVPVIFYTHDEKMIHRYSAPRNGFTPVFFDFINQAMRVDGVIIGTQSAFNKVSFRGKDVRVLPMPISERGLLEKQWKERRGVLFIGRWEQGKNPNKYLELIKETGLPAKVLTNAIGKKKFEDWFQKNGILDYDVRAGLIGQEKIDFITTSKVHYMPSEHECFPYAFYETFGHMPVFVDPSASWIQNFDHNSYYLDISPSNLKLIYNSKIDLEEWYSGKNWFDFNELHSQALSRWEEEIEWLYFEGKESNSLKARINNYITVRLDEYMDALDRSVGIEDIQSVYGSRHRFNILYTDKNTYLTKDPAFSPEDEEGTLEDLF
jgi:hypothetical protein